jgi:hypothetical protein
VEGRLLEEEEDDERAGVQASRLEPASTAMEKEALGARRVVIHRLALRRA